jgi:threonine aldolase
LRTGSRNNAPTSLIALENTHNMAGGTVYPVAVLDEVCERAHERGLKVHIDGARIFNAAAASGVPVARLARQADSVMFCLSKGLGAPVGSMLAGAAEAIEQARLYRKRLGGGMRQAGVLAAAGLLALEGGPEHLPEDHANARYLAEALSEFPGIRIRPSEVKTNIVIFDIAELGVTSTELSRALKARGVLANGVGPMRMRMVTHRDVSREECEQAVSGVRELASQKSAVSTAV